MSLSPFGAANGVVQVDEIENRTDQHPESEHAVASVCLDVVSGENASHPRK